jgi:hypothetical protein
MLFGFILPSPAAGSANRTITVTKDNPFQRDIVIVGEQTGLTFGRDGIYQIQVEYEIGKSRVLRSNTAELCILPDARRRDRFVRTVEAIKTPAVQALLRYRRSRDPRTPSYLANVIDSWKGPWDERKSLIGYRFARTILGVPLRTSSRIKGKAIRYLEKARHLGRHRDKRIDDVLLGLEIAAVQDERCNGSS